jgi:hypothetical protein
MAILEDSEIATKAEERTRFRLKSAGTKLNQQELRNLGVLAKRRGVRPGELIRKLILDELTRDAGTVAASTELTEIIGIRLMLTNLFRPLATGQKLTTEAFDNMVAEVKKRKRSVAEEALQDLERA